MSKKADFTLKYLRHPLTLHSWSIRVPPEQGLPPPEGAGLVHDRVLSCDKYELSRCLILT